MRKLRLAIFKLCAYLEKSLARVMLRQRWKLRTISLMSIPSNLKDEKTKN